MNSYAILEGEENQYHNITDGNIIYQYSIYEDMFKKKKMCNVSAYNTGIYDVKDIVASNDFSSPSHVWAKEQKKTVEQNREYWEKILLLLQKINKEMKTYVMVFPQNPEFYLKYKDIVCKTKKMFYAIMQESQMENIELIDYFDYFAKESQYFEDDCHLNTSGRKRFTKEVLRAIYRER